MTEGLGQLLPEQGFPLLPIAEVSLHRAASAENEVLDCFADYVAESFRSDRKAVSIRDWLNVQERRTSGCF